MALSRTAKQLLAQRADTLPSTEECQALVRDYLARTGLTQQAFAHRIRRSVQSLWYWFKGDYERICASGDINLRATIVDFIEQNPIGVEEDSPFDRGKLYETANVKLLREDFYQALDRARIVLRHGNPGTQKSFAAKQIIAELNRMDAAKNGHGRRAYYIYCRHGMTAFQFMRRLAQACGVPCATNIDDTINNLRFEFRGRRVCLWLDEAHHLDYNCLEVVRELNDQPPHFGLMITGSHDLVQRFDGFAMEQWRERLQVMSTLPSITREEARMILNTELPYLKANLVEEFINEAITKDRAALMKEAHATHLKEVPPYISARNLFWTIRETQDKRAAAKKGGANA